MSKYNKKDYYNYLLKTKFINIDDNIILLLKNSYINYLYP